MRFQKLNLYKKKKNKISIIIVKLIWDFFGKPIFSSYFPGTYWRKFILRIFGAKIGKGCLIGANSFIAENKEIPDNSIVLGAPGKIIGEVQEKHRAMMERAQKSYVRRSVAYKTDLNDVTDNFKY